MSTMINEKVYNMLYLDKYGSGEIKTRNIDTGAISTAVAEYCDNDVIATEAVFNHLQKVKYNSMWKRTKIKNVIFNDPATIVFWSDGTKTVVKCGENDIYDPEKGLAMAVAKKYLGTNKSHSNYMDEFKKWLPKEKEQSDPIEDFIDSLKKIAVIGSSLKEGEK